MRSTWPITSPTGPEFASFSATTSSKEAFATRWIHSAGKRAGARILLKEVEDAERFGVAEIAGDTIVRHRGEADASRSRTYAVTGFYMYDETVFEKIQTLVPSDRGELEITDVNNAYIREGTMTFSYLDGWWTDAGTFDSLLRAANLVARAGVQRAQQEVAEYAAGRNSDRKSLSMPKSDRIRSPECRKGSAR